MAETRAGSGRGGGWGFPLLLAAAALVQGVLWAILTPPWQAPDEPSHFAYVQHLYETGTWRPPGRRHPFSRELARSLRLLHGEAIRHDPDCTFTFTPGEAAAAERALSRMRARDRTLRGRGRDRAGHYPPLYYWAGKAGYGLFARADIVHRLFGVRLAGVFFFACTVFFSALAARELAGGDGPAARAAACFVLLLPMHGFIAASANCDALLFAASALFLYLCARLLSRGGGWRLHLAVAAALGLGLLAKPTFAPLALLWPLAARPGLRRDGAAPPGRGGRRGRTALLCFMGAVLLVSAVLFLRYGGVYLRYFDDALEQGAGTPGRSFFAYLGRTFLDLVRPWSKTGKRFYGSYFADFGWMDTSFPFALYLAAWMCAAAGTVRAALLLRRRADGPGAAAAGPLRFALLGAAIQFFAVVVMGYVMAHHYSWGSSGLQGRYLFPALALHGVILARGLVASWRTEAARLRAARILVLVLVFWQFASFARVFARYYC